MINLIKFNDDIDCSHLFQLNDDINTINVIDSIDITLFKAKKFLLIRIQSECKKHINTIFMYSLFKLYNEICINDLIITHNSYVNFNHTKYLSIENSLLNIKLKLLLYEVKNFIISDLYHKFSNKYNIITNDLVLLLINRLHQDDIFINFITNKMNKYIDIYYNIDVYSEADINLYIIN